MPIPPNFLNVENNVWYSSLMCLTHNERRAVVYLDIGRSRENQLVIGLCDMCVERTYQALEPYRPTPDLIESQHEQEYDGGER